MRRVTIGLLIVTWLRAVALTGGPATESVSHDRDAAVHATEPATGSSPWIDLAPARVLSGPAPVRPRDHRLTAGLTLGALYAGFAGWAYLAWYRNHPEKPDNEKQSIGDIWSCAVRPSEPPNPDKPKISCDGWFGVRTYAGGADKAGHAWATMVLARGGTALLQKGGWSRTRAAITSAVLANGLFLAVEIKDYYYYEFSPGDFATNTLGAMAAVALDLSPRLDELLDFRVEWWPSRQYRHNVTDPDSPCAKRVEGQPSCSRWNVAEDYSGQTYLLAFHLGGIHSLRNAKYGWWAPYLDVSLGFKSRNYKPPPTLLMAELPEVERTQELFIGLSFNMQGLVDRLLPKQSTVRKVGHGVLEVLTPPLTAPVFGGERSTTSPGMGGA